ncbi:hypothetical protein Cgig2_029330 [Carnegiea gigantea]|uniref:Uncharacterized protein n=1 Tax=Carnegiea gigantea TaxID=171969 RepID=A0A9Q1QP44_9CARY|nr:hypothetical protein Cgig2_029330 [Carnegiea gigantea]
MSSNSRKDDIPYNLLDSSPPLTHEDDLFFPFPNNIYTNPTAQTLQELGGAGRTPAPRTRRSPPPPPRLPRIWVGRAWRRMVRYNLKKHLLSKLEKSQRKAPSSSFPQELLAQLGHGRGGINTGASFSFQQLPHFQQHQLHHRRAQQLMPNDDYGLLQDVVPSFLLKQEHP